MLARVLSSLRLEVAAVWHSPKARSRQTAEIIHAAVSSKAALVERRDLRPNSSLRQVLRDINGGKGDLMIVGHEPHLGKLVSQLLTREKWAQVVDMAKAGVVCLRSGPSDGWQVAWAATPELLQAAIRSAAKRPMFKR